MSLFDGENLFGSGPHRFHIGGLSLRHVLHETAGGRGVRLSALGQHGRSITQAGKLIADSPDGLQILIDAVEAKLDGLSHVLVDDQGRSWPNTVMLSYDPGAVARAGARIQVSYGIQYLQLTP